MLGGRDGVPTSVVSDRPSKWHQTRAIDRIASGLDGKGDFEAVNGPANTDNAKDLRFAIARQIAVHSAKHHSRIGET